jgi:diaminopimelate decarboxylase
MLGQLRQLRRSLGEEIGIYYSVKANPHPKVIALFVREGVGCEIASGGEYALVRSAGASFERIVFAGPGKGRDELEYVVAHGIGEIHIESFEEIELLEEIARHLEKDVGVAIRLNPASAAVGGGLLMGGGQPTAFGFEEESLPEVVRTLRRHTRLKLKGVHLYTGTQILDAGVLLGHWRRAVEIAIRTAELADTSISTVDLGGGLGIPYFAHEKDLDLELLGSGAKQLIAQSRLDPRIRGARFVVEPGRFLVGPGGIYVARVRSVKNCRGTIFVVVDGGMNHNLAASGNLGQVVRRDYPILNLTRQSALQSTVVVVGPLCTPIDTLARKVTISTPRPGDLIGILQSGAYGLTASPVGFLSHATPAEVLVGGGKYEIITPRQPRFGVNQGCASE